MRGLSIILLLALLMGSAGAEDGWVMCQPDSRVNVRGGPSRHAEIVGCAYMGDLVKLDGRTRGNWFHCEFPCEAGEGWIRGDFLSPDEPEDVGSGRFQVDKNKTIARYSRNGGIRKYLKAGTIVEVYMVTQEWCVTSQGFIRTELLTEVGAE